MSLEFRMSQILLFSLTDERNYVQWTLLDTVTFLCMNLEFLFPFWRERRSNLYKEENGEGILHRFLVIGQIHLNFFFTDRLQILFQMAAYKLVIILHNKYISNALKSIGFWSSERAAPQVGMAGHGCPSTQWGPSSATVHSAGAGTRSSQEPRTLRGLCQMLAVQA